MVTMRQVRTALTVGSGAVPVAAKNATVRLGLFLSRPLTGNEDAQGVREERGAHYLQSRGPDVEPCRHSYVIEWVAQAVRARVLAPGDGSKLLRK